MHKSEDIASSFFWFFIIFYLDPGGLLRSNIDSIVARNVIFTFFYAVAFLIFLYKRHIGVFSGIKIPLVRPYIIIMIIWNIYFYVVYLWINNDYYQGPIKILTGHLEMFLKSIIVIPIIYFSTLSLRPFIRILTFTTIIIALAYIFSVLTGISIIDIDIRSRNMGGIKRNLMYGYGIMYYMIPLALAVIFFKYKKQNKIIIGALLAVAVIFLTVMRRDMIGIVELLGITAFLVNYIQNKKFFQTLTKVMNFKTIAFSTLFVGMLFLVAPKVIDKSVVVVEDMLHLVGLGESKRKSSDQARLSFTQKKGIIEAINNNIYFGTGYIEDWYTGAGGKRGLEGSDYIFLACLGMYGVIGLLIFFPFYIYIIKLISTIIKFVKKNSEIIYSQKYVFWLPIIVIISSSAEFIKNIIEYPNWFYPIGAINTSPKYYIFLGLLLGGYYNLKLRVEKIGFQKTLN